MASIRPCNKCGNRISIRQMPHGQWVAFDVGTDDQHKCSKKRTTKKQNIPKNIVETKTEVEEVNSSEIYSDEFNEQTFEQEIQEIENLKRKNSSSDFSETVQPKENGLPGWVFLVLGLILLFLFSR